MLGGTGVLAEREVARAIATEMPAMLAGGLRPENVADAVRDVPAIGVDVASGVEQPGTKPPRKDPLAVALFTKRATAARPALPQTTTRRQLVAPGLLEATARGHWGSNADFGGRYVPETLMPALLELEQTYYQIRSDPTFWSELRELQQSFAGRPTPVYR